MKIKRILALLLALVLVLAMAACSPKEEKARQLDAKRRIHGLFPCIRRRSMSREVLLPSLPHSCPCKTPHSAAPILEFVSADKAALYPPVSETAF